MPHPPMIGFKQSVKVFSTKFSLPTDPRKFSPSKVYRYTVLINVYLSIHWDSIPKVVVEDEPSEF